MHIQTTPRRLCGEIICLHKKGQTENPLQLQNDLLAVSRLQGTICMWFCWNMWRSAIDKQISDSQNGFCGAMVTKDNMLVVRAGIDQIIRDRSTAIQTFVNYSIAFDSASWRLHCWTIQCADLAGEFHHAHLQQRHGKGELRSLVDLHLMKFPSDMVCCRGTPCNSPAQFITAPDSIWRQVHKWSSSYTLSISVLHVYVSNDLFMFPLLRLCTSASSLSVLV